MEWTKYVLSMILGGCLLILFGRRGDGRNKWLLGLGVGAGLAAMELTVEYMLDREVWEMVVSLMKGASVFSVIVLAGYGIEWFKIQKEDGEPETCHPVRQWMEEYQESFAQLSRSFCMVPQLADGQSRGERVMQNRLTESRLAAAGQLKEMSQILVGTMERIYSTREDTDMEQEKKSKP